MTMAPSAYVGPAQVPGAEPSVGVDNLLNEPYSGQDISAEPTTASPTTKDPPMLDVNDLSGEPAGGQDISAEPTVGESNQNEYFTTSSEPTARHDVLSFPTQKPSRHTTASRTPNNPPTTGRLEPVGPTLGPSIGEPPH